MPAATKVSTRSATGVSGAAVTILAFTGDIASTSRDVMLDAFHQVQTDALLLDFRQAEYINSSGIAIVIQMLLEASKSGHQTIGIFGLTPHFTKVFNMVGVAKYATLSADEASALARL